jgi:hypothetical protein
VPRFGASLSGLVVTKLLLSLAVLATGFVAISDDDFSRLVIAQGFAQSPSFDPSGTSWLPLPFYAYGSVFAVLGNSLVVARYSGVFFGILSVLGVYVAARWLGTITRTAWLASLLSAIFPHAVYYGAATVPDYPTSVLILLGASSTASKAPRVRVLGALAIAAATLCRYESWPVAFVVSAIALFELRRSTEKRALLAAAVVAPLGSLTWLGHGILRHHDAFFFIKRVVAYKRALGGTSVSFIDALLTQPLAFFRGEPELVVVTVALLMMVALRLGRAGFQGKTWIRPTVALFSLLAFLVIGDLRDGSPTHHGERVLLSLWLGCAVMVAELLMRLLESMKAQFTQRVVLLFGLGLFIAITVFTLRPAVSKVEPFVDRSLEVALGQFLRKRIAEHEPIAVYTEDYGYFAVDAALGRPGRLVPLNKHDPRHPEMDPLAHEGFLEERLTAQGVRTFVVPATRKTNFLRKYEPFAEVGSFSVFLRNEP